MRCNASSQLGERGVRTLAMESKDRKPSVRAQWESAAGGWARWEPRLAAWLGAATEAMLAMAHIEEGARVLDLACGAGSQTLRAATRVGQRGHVVATDIAEAMLRHVREEAKTAGLENVSTLRGAAEELDLDPESFDAAICRLGLMLFAEPSKAVRRTHRALRRGARLAVVVFTTPGANPFMAVPMNILRRHAGKPPAVPGQPGIFALGGPGILRQLLETGGFTAVEERTMAVPLRMGSAAEVLVMMKEAFGAYRAVIADASEPVKASAWSEVANFLASFEVGSQFVAPAEVLIAAGDRVD